MEPFIVSARKYRPQTFKDVVGQEAITNTLLNAIENDHLAQALLFCGPRGVGKTTCARILAKQINQDDKASEDEDFAFNIFELDAASNNSVDDIRNLIDQVRIPPQVGTYKVYIIDEVHMLSQSAFNAFLKTLEEPPKHAIFILATTEKHKIIPTILSRCQIFDFKRITVKDTAKYLKYIAEQQGIEAEEDALHIIAQKSDGALRDALSMFDRVVSFSGKELTRKAVTENLNVLDHETFFETTDLILESRIPELLLLFNSVLSKGFEGHHFINGLASHFRDLLVCKHEDTIALLEVSDNAKEQYLVQSKKTSEAFLMKSIDLANSCDIHYKASKNHRLLVELTLMKMASIEFDGEKKNPEVGAAIDDFLVSLVPAAFFKRKANLASVDPKSISEEKSDLPAEGLEPVVESVAQSPIEVPKEEEMSVPSEAAPVVEEVPKRKINITDKSRRVSGLSISSLKAKREHELKKIDVVVDEDSLPREPFTEEEMQLIWANFTKKLDKAGRKIMASNLSIDQPKLLGADVIWIQVPNETMKKEIEREKSELISFLRSNLKNYDIGLKISVNEEHARQLAYTPEEKYEKLRQKNPAIDLLRKEFDLDF